MLWSAPAYVAIYMQMNGTTGTAGTGFFFPDHLSVDICMCTKPSWFIEGKKDRIDC